MGGWEEDKKRKERMTEDESRLSVSWEEPVPPPTPDNTLCRCQRSPDAPLCLPACQTSLRHMSNSIWSRCRRQELTHWRSNGRKLSSFSLWGILGWRASGSHWQRRPCGRRFSPRRGLQSVA
ncbi:unnamed protein product [Pleuronectes platessa]|uniref:Uncharacterized protein n=1 Tax=Pleuronectes platessa TaxID=8262 RepID=A0A9N7UAJ8_PLEPL|nr:unnamed protein product [Pleuronectes platessa]